MPQIVISFLFIEHKMFKTRPGVSKTTFSNVKGEFLFNKKVMPAHGSFFRAKECLMIKFFQKFD